MGLLKKLEKAAKKVSYSAKKLNEAAENAPSHINQIANELNAPGKISKIEKCLKDTASSIGNFASEVSETAKAVRTIADNMPAIVTAANAISILAQLSSENNNLPADNTITVEAPNNNNNLPTSEALLDQTMQEFFPTAIGSTSEEILD